MCVRRYFFNLLYFLSLCYSQSIYNNRIVKMATRRGRTWIDGPGVKCGSADVVTGNLRSKIAGKI